MCKPMYPKLQDVEWLTTSYVVECRTTYEIAAEVGCSASHVGFVLKRLGVELRPANARPKHGHTALLHSRRTYASWRSMLDRCGNPRHVHYANYGGRGISIVAAWKGPHGFETFLRDMGERPADTSLDRVDNDGGYGPDNCRWASAREQVQNRRKKERPVRPACSYGHPLSGQNLLVQKDGRHRCRSCVRAAQRRWKLRHKAVTE